GPTPDPPRPSRRPKRRRLVAAVPAPPRGFEPGASAQGLEWLAPRFDAAVEAAETPLVEGMPRVQWPRRSVPSQGLPSGDDVRHRLWDPAPPSDEEPRVEPAQDRSRPPGRTSRPRPPEPTPSMVAGVAHG